MADKAGRRQTSDNGSQTGVGTFLMLSCRHRVVHTRRKRYLFLCGSLSEGFLMREGDSAKAFCPRGGGSLRIFTLTKVTVSGIFRWGRCQPRAC